MPRYHFHIGADHLSTDAEGDVLKDDQEAKDHGLQSMVELLHSGGSSFWPHERLEVRIETTDGRLVARLETRVIPGGAGRDWNGPRNVVRLFPS